MLRSTRPKFLPVPRHSILRMAVTGLVGLCFSIVFVILRHDHAPDPKPFKSERIEAAAAERIAIEKLRAMKIPLARDYSVETKRHVDNTRWVVEVIRFAEGTTHPIVGGDITVLVEDDGKIKDLLMGY